MRTYWFVWCLIVILLISGCNSSTDKVPLEGSETITLEGEEESRSFPLTFTLVEVPQQFETIRQKDIEERLQEHQVSDGQVVIFKKPDDSEYLYAAYEMKETLYEIGEAGSFHNISLVSIEELSLFGQSAFLISGVFGANAPIQHYVSIEEEGISPILTVDTGNAVLRDIDQDGITEIVSSHGLPMQAYIYKRQDGDFYVADVNESIGAMSVILNEDDIFEVQFEEIVDVEHFIYEEGMITQIDDQNVTDSTIRVI